MDTHLYLIEDQGKFGFINSKGNIIIDPIYSHARNFHEGIAWVNIGGTKRNYDVVGGKWGFIDDKGSIIRQCDLDLVNIGDFSEGLSWVMTGANKYNGMWGIIDKEGNWVLEPCHDFHIAYRFHDGVSIVELNDKTGFVNSVGEIISKPQYDSVSGFSDGISWVNIGAEEDYDGFLIGGKWGIINLKGEYIIEPIYDNMQNFNEDVSWVCKDSNTGKWGLIDKNGTQLLGFRYERCFNFHNHEALVCFNSKWMFIDPNGTILRTLRSDIQDIKSYDCDLALIAVDGKYGFINKQGEIMLEPQYEEIKNFKSVAWVRSEEKWNIYNKESKELIKIPFQIDSVEPFFNNEAKIWLKGNKWGLINSNGVLLAEPNYDYVGYHREGYIWVNLGGQWGYSGIRGGKWGLIDLKGKFIVEPIFDRIDYFWRGDLLEVQIENKRGYINWKGEIVWINKYLEDTNHQ